MLPARRRHDQRVRPDWTALPLHPMLAAAYPVVFLFAWNAAEHLTLYPLWATLIPSVAGAALILLILGMTLHDWHRAALLTTVTVIGFFGYGHAWNLASARLDSQWPLIIVWMGLTALGLAAAWRFGRQARTATRTLNLVAALALLLNSWSLVGTMVALGAAEPPRAPASAVELSPDPDRGLPDIYNIILDRYAGPTALAEVYGFDNEPFLAALEERGFGVARDAHANYIKTPFSLSSMLNMEYLDPVALRAEANSDEDREPLHRTLRQPYAVATALKEQGYSYIHLSNWWAPGIDNVDADRTFRYQGQSEFSNVLGQTTLLRALEDPNAAPTDPWSWPSLRANTAYALDTLDEIPNLPGPKYVFAHLLIPHDPYVFDVDGSFMDRAQVERQGLRDSYIRQLQYTNTRMLALVDRIIRDSPDAVIVLHADEGAHPEAYAISEWDFDWHAATDEDYERKFGILMAMRVPGTDLETAGFHDDISSVNTFRVVFNARFGTDLDMLPDRSWAHPNSHQFYDFFEITDRLQR